jgi:hypothetical protein
VCVVHVFVYVCCEEEWGNERCGNMPVCLRRRTSLSAWKDQSA